MLNRKRYFIKVDDFQGFPVLVVLWLDFQQRLMVLALTFTKSLCLLLLRPAEVSLMLQLYENGSIKRPALADIIQFTKITNKAGLGED